MPPATAHVGLAVLQANTRGSTMGSLLQAMTNMGLGDRTPWSPKEEGKDEEEDGEGTPELCPTGHAPWGSHRDAPSWCQAARSRL